MEDVHRRGRGERAGLDRDVIVAAARGMTPDNLTMKGVADRLGVDRKALNHHITDRQTLLRLMAVDALSRSLGAFDMRLGETWEDACRGYAEALRHTFAECAVWMDHFRFTSARDLPMADPVETIAQRMLAAGFDAVTVGRGIQLLVTICSGFAEDGIAGSPAGHTHAETLRQVLQTSADGYPALHTLADAHVDDSGGEQFAFDIDAFVVAMRAHLAADTAA